MRAPRVREAPWEVAREDAWSARPAPARRPREARPLGGAGPPEEARVPGAARPVASP
ncbi:MAG TPA: hypothetical protein VNH14_10875 [Gemmatimonadales bacterium]|nr:hypothetical protein [Gemmatimonadales bacterium]